MSILNWSLCYLWQVWGNNGDIWWDGQTACYSSCGEMNDLVVYTSHVHGSSEYLHCSLQSALIFKDVKVRGFWVTQWKKNHSDGES